MYLVCMCVVCIHVHVFGVCEMHVVQCVSVCMYACVCE